MKAPALIPNLPDDMHCVQCCAKMAIDYFYPERQITIEELEKLTAFGPSGTWEMHELLNYESIGIESKMIGIFDYAAFGRDPNLYLRGFFGAELAKQFLQQTADIDSEAESAWKVSDRGLAEKRIPTRDDIVKYIADGWLVMLLVNIRKLRTPEEAGYMGHRVLAYDTTDNGVLINDTGAPARAGVLLEWTKLERAWADPDQDAKAMIAVRKLNGKNP
jgi:hypothetical protein